MLLLSPAWATQHLLLEPKKDPLRRKVSEAMEPSGFEPLTPCLPCRESRLRGSLFLRANALFWKGF